MRITPARAGKTEPTIWQYSDRGDHPRACGKNLSRARALHRYKGSPPRVREKLTRCSVSASGLGITPARAGKTLTPSAFLSAKKGSPPRVREKQKSCDRNVTGGRITPARAGKTKRFSKIAPVSKDHPRACGKNSSLKQIFLSTLGSPPRVREKLTF